MNNLLLAFGKRHGKWTSRQSPRVKFGVHRCNWWPGSCFCRTIPSWYLFCLPGWHWIRWGDDCSDLLPNLWSWTKVTTKSINNDNDGNDATTTRLFDLSISNNDIQSVTAVKNIMIIVDCCRSLKRLDISNNPICKNFENNTMIQSMC